MLLDFSDYLYETLRDEEKYRRLFSKAENTVEYNEKISFSIELMTCLQDQLSSHSHTNSSSVHENSIQLPSGGYRSAVTNKSSPISQTSSSFSHPRLESSIAQVSSLSSTVISTPTNVKSKQILKRITPQSTSAAPKSEKKRISLVNPEQSPTEVAQGVGRISLQTFMPLSSEKVFTFEDFHRLGLLFSHILHSKYYPISLGLRLLLSFFDVNMDSILQSPTTVRIFNKSNDLHLFLGAALTHLIPILLPLGKSFVKLLMDSELVRILVPDLVEQSRALDYDDICFNLDNDVPDPLSSQEMFIRPFIEESDSRNDYHSQLDAKAYNDRERCYDQFSNLFRTFQLNTTSADAEYWRIFTSESMKILDMMSCNMDWFSDVFVEMLLFYCPRDLDMSPSVPSCTTSVKSILTTPSTVSKTKNVDPFHVNRTPNLTGDGATDSRQRKLEERIGPGGRGGFQRQQRPQGFQQQQPRAKFLMVDKYEEPAMLFPGVLHFFFRFIVLTNNHLFLRALEMALLAEISHLSRKTEGGDASADQTALGISLLKLKTLGRIYGLVLFSGQWTLPLVERTGAVFTQLGKYAARRQVFFASRLPHMTALESAVSNGTLCIAVAWIAESLRMLHWDVTWQDVPAYCGLLSTLHGIQHSPPFLASSGRLTSNRLFVLVEIQALLIQYPVKTFGALCSTVSVSSSSVDDQNFVAETGIVARLFPFLHELMARLQAHIGGRRDQSSIQHTPLKVREGRLALLAIDTLSSPASRQRTGSASLCSPDACRSVALVKTKLFVSPSSLRHKETEALDHSAVQSFWQQHASLHKVSVFLLDYLQQAGAARLRDRVAHAVRELWGRAAILKDSEHLTRGSLDSYKTLLEFELQTALKDAKESSRVIMEGLLVESLQRLLGELSRVHPNDERVSALAANLIGKQAAVLQRSLGEFLLKFGRRKLDEVMTLSMQQYGKRLAEMTKAKNEPTEILEEQIPSVILANVSDDLRQSLQLARPYFSFTYEGVSLDWLYESFVAALESGSSSAHCLLESSEHHDVVGFHAAATSAADVVIALTKYATATTLLDNTKSAAAIQTVLAGVRLMFSCLQTITSESSLETRGRLSIAACKFITRSIYPLLCLDAVIAAQVLEDVEMLQLPSDILTYLFQSNVVGLEGIGRSLTFIMKPSYIAYISSCRRTGALCGTPFRSRMCVALMRLLRASTRAMDFVCAHKEGRNFPDPEIVAQFREQLPPDIYTLLLLFTEKSNA